MKIPNKLKVCVLPGDGIGPEVVAQAIKVLNNLSVEFEFNYGKIGYGCYQELGEPLPEETVELIKSSDATLFSAVTTPPNIDNYSSPVLRIRREFELYANVRPIMNNKLNFVIVRENTEGIYSGIERLEDSGNRAVTERIITRAGSERIVKYAFELAQRSGYQLVTAVHKANVMRKSCGLFRTVAYKVAEEYPEIKLDDMLVDRCAMELIRNPEQFQVIVTTNMFGDILSDEASMLIGGLGMACSGNIGDTSAMFEPVHGSAPELAGTGTANPIATIKAAQMMLEHLGLDSAATKIQNAVNQAISNKQVTTDLGGKYSTAEVGNFIADKISE